MEAWDAHVYFDGEDAASVEEALTLRYEVITSFPSLTVNRTRLSDPPPRRPSRTLTSRRCPALCCAQGLTERRLGPTRRRCFLWSCTPPYLPPSPPALIWPWPA